MPFDKNNFIVIGGASQYRPNEVYIHERINNNGKPGEIVTMADGRGNVTEITKGYIENGYDPKKIIINGQLAEDVFEHEKDTNGKKKHELGYVPQNEVYYDRSNPFYNPYNDPSRFDLK